MMSRMRSRWALAGAALALWLVPGVRAQQPAAPGRAASTQVTPVRQRIGIDPARRLPLTMRDAIVLALDNNRDVEIERLNVQLGEYDLRASQGAYDPQLVSSIYYDRRNTPVANVLATGPGGALLTDNFVGTANLTQRTPWQGGSYQFLFDNNRSTTDNPFNALNPQYATTLSLTYTQPLWRNRTVDAPRRQIQIAKKRLDLSDSQFRQRAIEIIAQTQRAYWDLVFAQRDYEIKRESVDLARTQLEHNQRLVEAGALAPADVVSARVEVERRTDEAEAAVETIQRAENSLKGLLLQPSNGELWNTTLDPVEQPQLTTDALLPLEDAVRLARQNRPEMEQYRLRGDLNRIDVDYYRNQTRPQIDFFASYGTLGLAGSLRPGQNPITASQELLLGRINELSRLAGLPPLPGNGVVTVPDRLLGGYGSALSNLFQNDFRTYRVGVNISLSLRNRTAEAQLGRALAEGRQIDVQRQRVDQQIEIEVRNALQAVDTAARRVEAARNSRLNADLQYQSEQRKFDAGQSTNFFVLDRQNALSAARGRELRALTDYTKAVAELQRALSTTLTSNSIEVRSAKED